jgi:hypothetical protein
MLIGLAFQLTIAVQAPDTATVNQPVFVRYRATAPGNTPPGISMPTVSGALVSMQDDRIRIGGGFGTAVATRELTVQVVPQRVGRLVIGPARASLGGEVALSASRMLFVRQAPQNAVPGVVSRAPLDGRAGIVLHALTTPDTVWVGEQLTVQVGIFIDDAARLRLLKNPDYAPPDVADAIAIELPVASDALAAITAGGRRYRPYVFARALFALQPGALTIPPARLTLVEADRNGDAVERTLNTPTRSVLVRELPSAGRPAAFSGAVGVYSMSVRVDSVANAREDGARLEVVVSGAGNVKLLPTPVVDVDGGTASVVRELVQLDTSDLLVRGSKTFRIAINSSDSATARVRAVRYAWFNPARTAYEEAMVVVDTVTSAATAVSAAPVPSAGPTRPVASVTPTWPWLGFDPWRWPLAAIAAALLGWGVALIARGTRRQRSPTPAVSSVDQSVRALRRSLVQALQPLLPPGAVADAGSLPRTLRRAGASPALATKAASILAALDDAVFRAGGDGNADATVRASVHSVIAELQRGTVDRRTPGAHQRMVRMMSALVLPYAIMQQPSTPSTVVLHSLQRAADAPGSASAWNMVGAAQAAAGDSSGALLAWRISTTIQPWRNPARDQLSPAAAGTSLRTRVPYAPPVLLVAATVVAVIVGLWAARRASQRQVSRAGIALRVFTPWCVAALPLAASLDATRASDLAFVREAVTLRFDPALAGEAVGRLRTGDIVIVNERQPLWWNVRSPEGRSGWVPAGPLRSLARADRADVARLEAAVAAGMVAP